MALPKIATPTYELEIPSIKKTIKYRPFLVKEEKVLIIAMESEDSKQIADAVKTVITNCILTTDLDIDQLTTFDIEYLFLNIRGKSVGENVEILITCPDDGTTQVPVNVDLDEIKVVFNKEHKKDIKLNNELSIRMKYPSMSEFVKNNFSFKSDESSPKVDETLDIICSCIEQIYDKEETWVATDFSKDEIREFVDQLTSKQFKEIEKFFDTMPKLSHTIKIKNPNTKVENKVVLEGLNSFFV